MTSATDLRWMRTALALGRRGMGSVWPNPAVGCVIVQGDRVVGRGWTQPGGRPHAEAMALAQAGAAARGGTAYVTLEPCAHTGKTPPCSEALIAAGVARVVTALTDPDPRVAGQGHAKLRAAGITVVEGVCADHARWDQRGFLSRITRGRPHLTLKLALSLDGRIATASGESQWITGAAARRFGHYLRSLHDLILVGAGTARADNPSLNVRDMGVRAQPVRAVATRRLDLPRDGHLLTDGGPPVWLLHGADAPQKRRAALADTDLTLIEIPLGPDGQLDPLALLTALGGRGITRIYCEGGGALAASLLAAGLVDELYAFTAGMGLGAEARPGLGVMGISRLAEAARFDLIDTQAIGNDVLSHWRARPD